jgi:hypothetical protein
MNDTLRTAAALGATLALFTLAACDRESRTASNATTKPDASAQVIGVQPAPPSGDPAGTTPVDGKDSGVSKQAESTQRPLEGDNHSYSSVSADNPQKSGGTDQMVQQGTDKATDPASGKGTDQATDKGTDK